MTASHQDDLARLRAIGRELAGARAYADRCRGETLLAIADRLERRPAWIVEPAIGHDAGEVISLAGHLVQPIGELLASPPGRREIGEFRGMPVVASTTVAPGRIELRDRDGILRGWIDAGAGEARAGEGDRRLSSGRVT